MVVFGAFFPFYGKQRISSLPIDFGTDLGDLGNLGFLHFDPKHPFSERARGSESFCTTVFYSSHISLYPRILSPPEVSRHVWLLGYLDKFCAAIKSKLTGKKPFCKRNNA